MRLIITYPQSLSNSFGGGTIGLCEIARTIGALGYPIVLIPVGHEVNPVPDLGPNISIVQASPTKDRYWSSAWCVWRVLKKAAYSTDDDWACISWGIEGCLLARWVHAHGGVFCVMAAKPSYAEWRSSRVKGWKFRNGPLDFRIFARMVRRADLVFALSKFTRLELVRIFKVDPKRICTAYWGVNQEFLRAEDHSLEPICPVVLFFGSLAPPKGIFDAIEALGLAHACGTDFEFRIAGWGDTRAIEKAVDTAGIGSRTEILGRLEHPELISQLSEASIALLPSRVESFGLAVVEAMASGTPVISYDAGSIPETLGRARGGWMVPLGRIDLLAQAVVEALSDLRSTKAFGERGRRFVADTLSWDRTARVIMDALTHAARIAGNSQ